MLNNMRAALRGHTLVDKEFADYLRVRIIESFCQVKCTNRPAMHVFEDYVRDSILNTFLGNSPKHEFGGGCVDPFLNLSLFESGSAADSPDYRHHSYGTHVVRQHAAVSFRWFPFRDMALGEHIAIW